MKSKKILITGATGFIGKNLTATLLQAGYTNLYLFDRENTQQQLEEWCTDAEFVFHLAGVNRPEPYMAISRIHAVRNNPEQGIKTYERALRLGGKRVPAIEQTLKKQLIDKKKKAQ